jgi:hypothetical protein
MRDIIMRIEQEAKTFTAKKDFVWTCNKDSLMTGASST